MTDLRVRRQRGEGGGDGLGLALVGGQNLILFENVERCQRCATGQRIAGVAVRMQEGTGDGVVEESGVDGIAAQNDRERQIAAADALGQAEQVGADVGLFVGEERAGAAEADGDFVADEMDRVRIAQGTCLTQVFRVIHDHAGSALYQRFENEGSGAFAVAGQVLGQGGGGAAGDSGGCFVWCRQARIRRGQHMRRVPHQRRVGFLEQGDVGDGQRTDGFAVVTAGQAEKFRFLRTAGIAPVMKAHLERNFRGGRAIGGVEGVAQAMVGQRRQPFRQLDHRRMGKPGQHGVFEGVELLVQGGVDAWVGVAEQVGPPRADAVEKTPTVEIVQPGPFAAGDRNQGEIARRRAIAVVAHLRARMPDRSLTPPEPVIVVAHQCRCGEGLAASSGISACTSSPSLSGNSGAPQSSQNSMGKW